MNNDKEIRKFVKTNSDYYIGQFQKIGNSSKLVISLIFLQLYLVPSGLVREIYGIML